MYMSNLIHEIAQMQRAWNKMVKDKSITKQKMHDICAPFRDKYNLTDREALALARNEMSILEIDEKFNKDELDELFEKE